TSKARCAPGGALFFDYAQYCRISASWGHPAQATPGAYYPADSVVKDRSRAVCATDTRADTYTAWTGRSVQPTAYPTYDKELIASNGPNVYHTARSGTTPHTPYIWYVVKE
ncbi:MAG: hypothetical protein V3W37_10040, partial [Candidatus Binatia bacterium]